MSIIKRIVETLDEKGLNQLLKNFAANVHLVYSLELLLEDLNSEASSLKNLVLDKLSENDEENLKKLEALSIINRKKEFTSFIFGEFLKHKFNNKQTGETISNTIHISSKLTKNEYKILEFLTRNSEQVCSREELAIYVWGENASLDVSNHAIDQLIHRLRKKISGEKSGINLETLRGRGHRLLIG